MASYDEEFKKRIVRKHMGERRTIRSLSEKYHVSEKGIGYWLKKYREECSKDPAAKEEYDLMKENLKLRKELEEMKNENNFLKKSGSTAVSDRTVYPTLRTAHGACDLQNHRGTFGKTIAKYKKPALLILDEWLLYQLKESEALDLLEIAEARYKKGSIIFVPNLMYQAGGIRLARRSLQMQSVTASCMIPTEL